MSLPTVSRVAGTTVVGLGEALFDCFPGRSVLGGAPVNVAVHANALLSPSGGRALPATRVGADELGDRFFAEMRRRGAPTDAVQRDRSLPTGRVAVEIDAGGDARYVFDQHSAWDAIVFDEPLARRAADCSAVAFGTLGQRADASREAIRRFLSGAPQAFRLLDVNLRQQYYSPETLDSSLRLASAAKLSEDEVNEVCELLDLTRPSRDVEAEAELLGTTYRLDWVAVTRGARGASLFCDGDWQTGQQHAARPQPGADTVGAGDSCCAALLCGFLAGMPSDQTLSLANEVGAHVASVSGATPPLPDAILTRFAQAAAEGESDPQPHTA
mgnify:CR=1 FL=1